MAGANITLSTGPGATTIIGGVNTGATTFAIGVSTDGNSAGTTGTVNLQMELVGGNNITLSESKNGQSATVTFVGPSDHQSIGMSDLGNTSGTTGVATGSNFAYFFAGGSNITLSQSLNGSSGTLTIFGPDDVDPQPAELIKPVASNNVSGTLTQFYAMADHQHRGVFSAGVSDSGATAGTTGVYPCQLVLVGSNITLSQSVDSTNGLTVSFIANTEGTISEWIVPNYGGNTTFQQIGQNTLKVFPAILAQPGSFSLLDAYGSVSYRTAGGQQYSGSASFSIGIYTKNASSLSLASSGSQSYSWQANGNLSLSLFSGMRHFSVPINLSMLPGNYWVGFLSQTTFASQDSCSISNYGAVISPAWVNDFGAAPNATHQYVPGLGAYSTTTNALPAAIGFSELVGSASSTMAPFLDFLAFNFT